MLPTKHGTLVLPFESMGVSIYSTIDTPACESQLGPFWTEVWFLIFVDSK